MDGHIPDLIGDANSKGEVVLVVEPRSEAWKATARKPIKASVRNDKVIGDACEV